MALVPLLAMIRKDLKVFFSDRRSVIVSFVVPIAIASFFGSIFSGPTQGEPARIGVMVVDQDGSAISKAIVEGTAADKSLRVTTPDEGAAREAVRRGNASVGVIIPGGFGEAAGAAFFGTGEKPALQLLYDPSNTAELAMVRGILTQHVMQAVSREMFGGVQGRAYLDRTVPQVESSDMNAEDKRALLQMLRSVREFYDRPAPAPGTTAGPAGGLTIPYTVREEALTSGANVAYNGYAHSFAGMAVQFLLFAMANLGIEMLVERQRGLWKRLRSAPVSRVSLLAGKWLSGALISLLVLLVCFAFAMIVFGVRIHGSVIGFLGVAAACSLMASAFGVLVAALGNSPATARGVTTLAVLLMVMLGGGWVPTFVFPAWLRQLTVVVPVRWAVDGLDAMTWRGIGLAGALPAIGVLLGFAVLFSAIALMRFRWEES
jgi:ABC-2 type transport system permease protein